MAGMSWDILAMLAVGIGAAAALYAALHAASKAGFDLPRWLLPAGIGLAMLGFTVWNEYTWFPRVRDQLPARVEVLEVGQGGKAWRPWAWLVPMVTRFTALDPAMVQQSEGLRQAPVLLVERWQPTRQVTVQVDCAAGRQRMLAASGTPTGWSDPAPADPLIRAMCKGG
ncbi:MAG: hypothetical protein Q4G24_11340 [Paracoccus sp. (in: a-proteobacteria)]|uniref:hypothetical protein n=1 Tax=Paracoccus sp. TaxID=267 RepID=UPI0026DF49CD|nr:hypothetical protein [Paracoccus sp. (in: a-proteobacteria)]MDO5622050.1 hypothetical protein [Paracoccus sp. (in: a-proteobacteria)]